MHGIEWIKTLARYLAVSVSVYVFILAAMYLLVDRAGIREVASYVIVYATAYVVEYLTTLRFVFRAAHNWRKVLKFALNTALFLLLGTWLFEGALLLGVNYLVATLGVAVLLLPARFLSNRFFVYA